jgi:hypothetical protein
VPQMNRSTRASSLIAAAVLLLNLAACSTTRQWNVTGGDRSAGVVRVSYEYPEFEQRKLSDEQAMQIATSRCNGWGYEDAEPIPGQIRQCGNMDGANCNLWTVTREYRCTEDASFAAHLSK